MKASAIVLFTVTLATTGAVYAQTTPQVPYPARAFTPAHADLLRSAGVPAQLANAAYVEALARIVYYWGYAAVDQFGRRGMWELSANQPGQRNFACESTARNKFYPPGVTAEMLAADPNVARPAWVVPTKFWEDLKKVLTGNPTVGAGDSAMADQARALVALHDSSPVWKALLDRASLTAKAALRDSGLYTQVGVDSGNGWQRQENGGVWETDWFGRALAAKVYIYVNDYCEAMYLIRGTDPKGTLLGCSQCLSKPSLSVEMRTLVLHVSQRAEACSYVAPAHDRVEAS